MSQIVKKFIGNNQVGGDQLRLENDTALRARNAANDADVEILKLDGTDNLVFSQKPQSATAPVADNDLTNKLYVDSVAAGLDPKQSVRVATTADLGATYATTPSNGQFTDAPTAIDGVTLVVGDRVLVKDQTDAKENGIYVYTAPETLTRSPDMDGTPSHEVSGGNFTFAEAGTANSGKGYVLVFDGEVTLNTDDVDFTQFSSAGAGANTELSNLTTTEINADLLPDATATRSLGSDSLRWQDVFANQSLFVDSIYHNQESSSFIIGTEEGIDATQAMSIKTGDISTGMNSTGSVSILTGNQQDVGDSGSLTLETGSSSQQTSGSVILSSGSGETASGSTQVSTGDSGSGSSGQLEISTGDSVNASGNINIISGTSVSGASGNITLSSGSSDVQSGNISISSFAASNTGAVSGNIEINTGNADNASGGVTIQTGQSATTSTGALFMATGNSTDGSSGNVDIWSGDVVSGQTSGQITVTTGGGTGSSGALQLFTGNSDEATGNILIKTGDSVNEESGNIILETGTEGTTRGTIRLNNGSEGIAGYVWTSIDINGSGEWAAVPVTAWNKEAITLDGTDITNQYVDLEESVREFSIMLMVDGVVQREVTDYTVSLTGGAGGVTRVTFAGDLATGGAAELIAGDVLHLQYQY